MIYLQRHKNHRAGLGRLALLGMITLIVILSALKFFAPHFLPSLMTSIFYPFWRAEFSISSGLLNSPESLVRENEELKRILVDNEIRMIDSRYIEMENRSLKELLGRSTTSPRILSAVMRRPPLTLYDEFIIDIGTDHNITAGSLVYAHGDIAIGRVADVLSRSSKVILFSSPNQNHEVVIGPDNSPTTAIGRGGGQYEAQVSRGVSVREGDYVRAVDLNSPLFGIVSAVISDPAQPFEKVLFAPPVNIYGLKWVLVAPNQF